MIEMTQGLLDRESNTQPQGGVRGQSDAVDMFLANGIRIIHDKKISDGFIKKVVKSTDPVKDIADLTLQVIDRLERSAGKKGVTVPTGELAQAVNILMGEIIDMAEMSGLEKLSEDDRYRAYSLAAGKYLAAAVKSGKISKEQLQEMSVQAQQSQEGQKMRALMEQTGGGQAQAGGQPAGGQPPAGQPPSPTPGVPPGMRR